ncbi:hypothetical protein CAPTEDRAFT_121495, partial [Capitella teleta]
VRILMVADPQLVGIQDESQIFGGITRWDLDRYLSKTFHHAVNNFEPDVILFLGDLLDEGSKASKEEYQSYIKRFRAIFQSTAPVSSFFYGCITAFLSASFQHVYIPGDNDVGGEAYDMKTDAKVKRFNRNFLHSDSTHTSSVTKVKFIDFLRVNLYVELMAQQSSHDAFHFLLNHMSILSRSRPEIHSLLERTKADLIIVAHSHNARLYSCLECLSRPELFRGQFPFKGGIQQIDSYESFHFQLSNRSVLHEVMVPTCSYRMGVPHMGYGAAVATGDVRYSILWTPPRYPQLHLMLAAAVCIALLLVIKLLSDLLNAFARRRHFSLP